MPLATPPNSLLCVNLLTKGSVPLIVTLSNRPKSSDSEFVIVCERVFSILNRSMAPVESRPWSIAWDPMYV